MSKDIKEYLHYYLGCRIDTEGGFVILAAIQKEIIPCTNYRIIVLNGNQVHELDWDDKCKLRLRKLESMEEDEAIELAKFVTDPRYHKHIQIFQIKPNKIDFMDGTMWQGDGVEEYNDCEILFNYLSAAQFHYLLSRGFDLFGLIDAGLAIDKETLPK